MRLWRRNMLVIGALLLFLVFSVCVSASMGFLVVPVVDVGRILVAKLLLNSMVDFDPVAVAVVTDVRLPRIIAAIFIGGILGVTGAVLQGVLLNPLADSYTLGISTGAAFGAALVIVLQILGIALPSGVSVPLFAFAGGVATLYMVLYLAAGDRRLSSTGLILAGVIVSAILSAAIGFFKFLAGEQVGIIIFWLLGSLSGSSWAHCAFLVPVGLVGTLVVFFYGRDLNVMASGERAAASLGINPVRLRIILLITCTFMTSLAVAVAGIIGFVGLIIPHLLRYVTGADNRTLIPLSFLSGALLLLVADTLTRAVFPAEVPIGVLTALLGGPFFCIIFKHRRVNGKTGF